LRPEDREADGDEVGREARDEQPTDEEPTDEEPEATAGEPAPPPPQKRFRAATDEELDPQSFIVADERSAVRAVLSGGSIASDRGDADFVGGAIRRIARALWEGAQNYRQLGDVLTGPLLRRVRFGASVVLELEISPSEKVQLGFEGARDSPTIRAARTIGHLLAAEPEQLRERALELGPDGAYAYKRFLNLLAGDEATLEWQTPGADEVVVVTNVDAMHDYAILGLEGEQTTTPVRVPGTLTMADSRRHRFELTLPADLERPPLLRRKRTVEGEYSAEVGLKLKTLGLWDALVMAEIEVTHDVPGTTPTPRDPTYRLVDAEPVLPRDTTPMFE
jgi:hypothetical protein